MKKLTVKTFLILCVWTVGVAFLPGVAFSSGSAGFAQPSAEYSADRIITMGSNTMAGKVYSASGKERMELKEGGGMINIVRADKKVIWTLMPSEKKYLENKFSEQKGKRSCGDYNDCDVQQKEKGKEEVNGFQTRKMEIDVSCPGNDRYTGTVWLTKENIPIRMETSKADSKKETVKIELKNLKIGKQDPALFEIPVGYTLMAIPSMDDIMKMMKK